MRNRITAIIVVYEKQLSTLPSLVNLLSALDQELLSQLIIYDNSQMKQELKKDNQRQIQYVHTGENVGLAKAYNYALKEAKRKETDLLLLLDQDTEVPVSYLSKLAEVTIDKKLGACLPLINAGGEQISPVYVEKYVSKNSQNVSVGLIDKPLMAINSGTALPIRTLIEIGGFNEAFPLDYLDHWMFWQLSELKKQFLVIDETLEHDLSVLDYSQVSTKRYESIIKGESLYYLEYDQSKFAMHRNHLKKRLVKQFLTVKNREIYKRTLSEIKRLNKGE